MLGEPFKLPLSEIANLTDRQIQRLYIEPAKKQAEQMKEASGVKRPRVKKVRIPTREEFARNGVAMFGKTEDYWMAEYDRMTNGVQP